MSQAPTADRAANPLLRGLMLTVPTAFAASLLGSLIFWLITAHPSAPIAHRHDGGLSMLGLMLLSVPLVTGWAALGGLLLFGFPLSWPFRRAIVRRPLAAAILLALIGCGAATLLFNFLDRNSAFPDPVSNALIAFSFGAPTAICWVAALYRYRSWLFSEVHENA